MPAPPSRPAGGRRAALGLALAALAPALAAPRPARAQTGPLPPAAGPVLLSVAGNVARANAAGRADFDRTMLESMPQGRLVATTVWMSGPRRFEGPLIREVLARAGATGPRTRAVALNDYAIEIPTSDFTQYDVLLALRMDGRALTVRDKGPIWIVYPRDDHPELRDNAHDNRWVWQLRTLEVR